MKISETSDVNQEEIVAFASSCLNEIPEITDSLVSADTELVIS